MSRLILKMERTDVRCYEIIQFENLKWINKTPAAANRQ
jgi:hypothetical protein